MFDLLNENPPTVISHQSDKEGLEVSYWETLLTFRLRFDKFFAQPTIDSRSEQMVERFARGCIENGIAELGSYFDCASPKL
ncbi:hypothetical protein ACU4GR_25910 [Methylobacterium oryzae CBMB20]